MVVDNYYMQLIIHDLTSTELCILGVGIGGDYGNTNELHTMSYQEGMTSNEYEEWQVVTNYHLVSKCQWSYIRVILT